MDRSPTSSGWSGALRAGVRSGLTVERAGNRPVDAAGLAEAIVTSTMP
jgi:hypothetical protein